MAVYTLVEKSELADFLGRYDIGTLQDFCGISAGIENSNYFVDVAQHNQSNRYVLTLFEKYSIEELPYFIELMAHLNRAGIASAKPIPSCDGTLLHLFKDRPAVLVECLKGQDVSAPQDIHLAQIAANMAKMHLATASFTLTRENCRSFDWWQQAMARLANVLPANDYQMIVDEIHYQQKLERHKLPQGAIHADLFRDNALFFEDQLTGIIDFYFACNDVYIYDIAVALNDWCSHEDGYLNMLKTALFLRHYQQIRPLNDLEKAAFGTILRAAALRFWLSRLVDFHFPREGELTHIKNPDEFKNILIARIKQAPLVAVLLTHGLE